MARSPALDAADQADRTATTDTAPAVTHLKFETALAELEAIVLSMEGGQLPLEESIAAYRRGSELLKHCQEQLSDAENRIQILENGVLRNFEANSGKAQ